MILGTSLESPESDEEDDEDDDILEEDEAGDDVRTVDVKSSSLLALKIHRKLLIKQVILIV